MTVADLRRRMTTAEKVAWLAYDRYREARQRQVALKGQLAERIGRKHARR